MRLVGPQEKDPTEPSDHLRPHARRSAGKLAAVNNQADPATGTVHVPRERCDACLCRNCSGGALAAETVPRGGSIATQLSMVSQGRQGRQHVVLLRSYQECRTTLSGQGGEQRNEPRRAASTHSPTNEKSP
jgi:hypothetical protein